MSSDDTKMSSGRYMGSATERLAKEQAQIEARDQEGTPPLIDVAGETAALKDLARRILDLPDGTGPGIDIIQDGLTSFSKLYADRVQSGEQAPPFNPRLPMPVTVAMTTTSGMVSQVNIELFELGMWRMWSEK